MGKAAVGSTTIIASLVCILAAAAPMFGYILSPDDQASLAALIQSGLTVGSSIVGIVAAAVAIWGRVTATKQITGVLSATPAPVAFSPERPLYHKPGDLK